MQSFAKNFRNSFHLVLLQQGSNFLTVEEITHHNTILENIDEFLNENNSANGMNSSDKYDCCCNNEGDKDDWEDYISGGKLVTK